MKKRFIAIPVLILALSLNIWGCGKDEEAESITVPETIVEEAVTEKPVAETPVEEEPVIEEPVDESTEEVEEPDEELATQLEPLQMDLGHTRGRPRHDDQRGEG